MPNLIYKVINFITYTKTNLSLLLNHFHNILQRILFGINYFRHYVRTLNYYYATKYTYYLKSSFNFLSNLMCLKINFISLLLLSNHNVRYIIR
jgi:hypothetical protein